MVLSPSSTPTFPRSLRVGLEESNLVFRWFADQLRRDRVMFDVGAHHGTSSQAFAERGWRVHAFEPDPGNRAGFERRMAAFGNVTVDPRAVSETDGDDVTLYKSEESSGISSLVPFVESHRAAVTVQTVRLDTFIMEAEIDRIDFLKIDTEGFDLMVLRGFPWDDFTPDVVLCEYEDKKTDHLDYRTGDMLSLLEEQGYSILISEWHPIERYGITHSFARLRLFGGEVPPTESWGNIIAVRDIEIARRMVRDSIKVLEPRADDEEARLAKIGFDVWRRWRTSVSKVRTALTRLGAVSDNRRGKDPKH
jgi:FkbM family methyltransferase